MGSVPSGYIHKVDQSARRISPKGICPNGICPKGICPKGICPKGICPNGICPNGICPNGICPQRGFVPPGFVHKVDQLIFVPVESTKTVNCFPLNKTLNVKLFHCEGSVPLNTNSPFFTRIPPNPMVIAIQVPAMEVM